MEDIKVYVFAAVLLVWLIFTVRFYYSEHHISSKMGVKFIVRVGVFGAISAVLYIFIKFPIPIFPSFLEIHIDEIPIFIAGFAYGPWAAVFVTLVKTIIKLPLTSTMCVGELCDFLYTLAFVVPASIIYKRHRSIKGALVGLAVGVVFQLIAAVLGNIYIILPFYMKVMEFPKEAILAMCQKANPMITNLEWAYGLFAVLPFNLIKIAIVVVLTFLIYKSTRRFIDKMER